MRVIGIKASKIDNVATVFCELEKEREVIVIDESGIEKKVLSKDDIPYGHKIAIEDIEKGDKIFKYGEIIGIAIEDINKGEYVHIHNLESTRGRGDLRNV